MDAAVGAAASGGGGSSGGLVPSVEDGDGGVREVAWTDQGTEAMLNMAVRSLRHALPLGKEKFNRKGFWVDLSSCLQVETKVARTPGSCEARYNSVMNYYARNRGTKLGRVYSRFAAILEEVIPLDDELQPRSTTTTKKKKKKKKIKASSKKRPSTEAAGGSEGQQPAAKRAAGAGGGDASGADRVSELVQMVRQLITDLHAWRANQEAQIQAWRAQDEQWKAHVTSMIQGLLNINQQPATNVLPLDALFPGANDFIVPRFP